MSKAVRKGGLSHFRGAYRFPYRCPSEALPAPLRSSPPQVFEQTRRRFRWRSGTCRRSSWQLAGTFPTARWSVGGGRANTITLTAPYAVVSGEGLLVGSIFGVGAGTAASGEPVETALVGVFDLTKVGSQAWTVGAKVYWDDTNKRTTTVSTDNTLIGVAVEAVASGAGDTIGRVRLNASF
ncbi:DUF2190 family protein [Ancylobacter sp. 6x-1]|uniref:DUF2190 family protein n=1 Tax=Ancylobacter crimeensis TaxID=2579147 RepID=A0ABT0D702_9HYPH|nr:DUF2190 family protein [Ancylobacter crimeensis]MCK0195730.1 DUF2190 family protein [Ancylobacter crimeensis]